MSGKTTRIIGIVVGVVLMVSGFYKFYNALGGDTVNHDIPTATMGKFVADKKGVEFCVTTVDNQKTLGSAYFEVTTEFNFAIVNVTITNNSDEPYNVNSLRFLLVNGDEEYQYYDGSILSVDNVMTMDTINPRITKEYVIVYETPVPTHEGDFSLKILPNAYSNKDYILISLNRGGTE